MGHAAFEAILRPDEPLVVGDVLERFGLHPPLLSLAALARSALTVFVLRCDAATDLPCLGELPTVLAGAAVDLRPCAPAEDGSLHHFLFIVGDYVDKVDRNIIISSVSASPSGAGSTGSPCGRA